MYLCSILIVGFSGWSNWSFKQSPSSLSSEPEKKVVVLTGIISGPLLLVPFANMLKKVTIYHVGNVGFIAFIVACTVSTNFNILIAFRFLAGLIGSALMTVGGGTIADIMPPQKRSFAIMIWNLLVVAGPVVSIASSILNIRSVVIQMELILYFLSSDKRKAI